jgi:hypothetical protein
VTIIESIESKSSDCIVVVGSDNCVACKQIVKALDKNQEIKDLYYIDIGNAYNYLNTLKQKTRSLPVTLIYRSNTLKNVLVGNVNLKTIMEGYRG